METEQFRQLFLPVCTSLMPRRMRAATLLEARWRSIGAGTLLAGGLLLPTVLAGADPGTTELVSVDSAGTQGNNHSLGQVISPDGRFVAFSSDASNLVPGDTNEARDVFVHDRQTGSTERVSVDSAGSEGNGSSFIMAISADARFVAFSSEASNLVPDDTNGAFDVFVHDRQTGITTRVSVDSAGTEGNGGSVFASLSADGRFVAFDSDASNLVPSDTNGVTDVFVHDCQTGTTTRVSVGNRGKQANSLSLFPSLSADGRFVAFDSFASNLVPGDTNGVRDVFVHDRQTRTTERVSVDSGGTQGNGDSAGALGSLSADGRFVAFSSGASNLVPGDTNFAQDVFVHDRQTGTTTRVSVGNRGQAKGASSGPRISADGRFVAFTSDASNLVPNDTNFTQDVFIHDRQTGTTRRVSVDSAGNQGDALSESPWLSADGRFVAFNSVASNLVPGDTNFAQDVFVHDRATSAATEEEEVDEE